MRAVDESRSILEQVRADLEEGRYERGIAACRSALEEDPEESAVRFELGCLLRALHRDEEALTAFSRCMNSEAHRARSQRQILDCLRDLIELKEAVGDYYDAAIYYRRYLAMEPDNARYWINLGVCLVSQGALAAALEAFDGGLRVDHRNAAGWFNKGLALAELERPAEAMEAFDRALALEPTSREAWFHKGQMLLSLPDSFFGLGKAIGKHQARECLRRALAIDPDYEEARAALQALGG
jgi:tetratricopeptide (TPR) repeat protein